MRKQRKPMPPSQGPSPDGNAPARSSRAHNLRIRTLNAPCSSGGIAAAQARSTGELLASGNPLDTGCRTAACIGYARSGMIAEAAAFKAIPCLLRAREMPKTRLVACAARNMRLRTIAEHTRPAAHAVALSMPERNLCLADASGSVRSTGADSLDGACRQRTRGPYSYRGQDLSKQVGARRVLKFAQLPAGERDEWRSRR